MTTVRVKTKSGHVQDLSFAEIIEIDGKSYEPAESDMVALQRIAFLEGRIAAIENIFIRQEEEGT